MSGESKPYKRVFRKARFDTAERCPFQVDQGRKSLIVGARSPRVERNCYVGKVIEHSRVKNILDYDVFVDVEFPHVVGLFGSRGSGKSFDIGILAEGINDTYGAQNEGRDKDDNRRPATLIFDVQDQFWTLGYAPDPELEQDKEQLALLEEWGLDARRYDRIEVWLPEASDSAVPNTEQFAIAGSQLNVTDWLALLQLERFSSMGQALITLLRHVQSPTPEGLSEQCEARGVLNNFQTGTVDGLRWRLESLAETGLITTTGFDVDRFLRPNSISVILLRNLPDSIRSLIVGVFARLVADRMTRFHQARQVALRRKDPLPDSSLASGVWMFLDEAHVLVPSDQNTAATRPLIDYVKRGRDAGLSLVFATQQPSAVDNRLMSQVDLTLTHTLGFEADLGAAVARMPTRSGVTYTTDATKLNGASEVLRMLKPGEAILADTASGRILLCSLRPRLSAHGGATPK